MRSILVPALLVLFSSSAFALENSLALGGGLSINGNKNDEDLPADVKDEYSVGYNIGARAILKFSSYWGIRTGLYLQEKSSKYTLKYQGNEGGITARVISASVPVNVQYQMNDQIQAFAGYVADFTINDYCSASGDWDWCTIDSDPKSIVHHANLGLSIKGNHLFDIDLSYQYALSDIYEGLKVHSFLAQVFFKL